MTGLFLNFYQVQLSANNIQLKYLSYEDYETKEDFLRLRKEYPNCSFYRDGDKIIFWSLTNSIYIPTNWKPIEISEITSPKIFSKIMEDAIVKFISNLNTYRLFKNKYSNTWDIVSGKDVLNGGITGFELNRIVHFAPYFFFKDDVLIFGFTISTSVKNRFTWSKQEFESNGIDTKGLRGDEENIYPNKQSLKRFLETKGVVTTYDNAIRIENDRNKSVATINAFYEWLNKKKSDIILPDHLSISTIIKKYIPFENNLIKSEVLYKPQRYFYSNSKNTQKLQYYDQMVKAYKPYSLELYQNKKIKLGVICPKEFQGETEAFLKQIEFKLKDTFHFTDIVFNVVSAKGKALEDYKDVLYDSELLESNLVYVIVSKDHEKLAERNSPYHVCKAKLIGNGIPTQDIQIETIRKQYSAFTMTNITLNTYAKLGGTAWTIEKEDKLREELIVGVGSTMGEDGQHVLGIAQVFHNDGRYILGDCAPLSTFSDYSKNLENHLYSTLKSLVDEMQKSGTFRLIFHLYKSASEKYEIKAIHNLQHRFSQYNFEFALVHVGYGHNFRLYNNEGLNDISQGTYIQLSKYSALLHFVPKTDLPLKIDLDKRSTFTSLFYLAKQIYWFSHLSHRSYMPSKRTVTIMYPSIMARMTEELKKVEGWDYERLKAVSEKLWFI